MGLDFLVPIFGILVVLVPVTGLTIVLTAKFATKPIVEALGHRRGEQGYASPGELQIQVQDLSEQVQDLTGEILRLKEAQSFDNRLLSGKGE